MKDSLDKESPCWEGYVQRGMKPGADGKPVPNCVPAEKSDSQETEKDVVANNNGVGIKNPEDWPTRKSLTDSNGMPSATGQPHPASDKDFVTPVPKSKTDDTDMSEEMKRKKDKALFSEIFKAPDNMPGRGYVDLDWFK